MTVGCDKLKEWTRNFRSKNNPTAALYVFEGCLPPKKQIKHSDEIFEDWMNRDNDVIYVTYSELAILNLIKKFDVLKIAPERIFFSVMAEDGKVYEYNLDGTYEFTSQWVEGFFEEAADLLFY
jgi:hypothetical protein